MAYLRIPSTHCVIEDVDNIRSFLLPHGIHYDRWPVAGRIDRDASPEAILAAYAPEVEALKRSGGYITADVVNVTPDLPGLQQMLEKFNQEHRHAEDEVRFIIKGRGLFYINPANGDPVFSIEIEEGDLINVPAGTKHWFDLCPDRTIRAIRLFRERAGWIPLYTGDASAGGYQPLCLSIPPTPAKAIQIDQAVAIAA